MTYLVTYRKVKWEGYAGGTIENGGFESFFFLSHLQRGEMRSKIVQKLEEVQMLNWDV